MVLNTTFIDSEISGSTLSEARPASIDNTLPETNSESPKSQSYSDTEEERDWDDSRKADNGDNSKSGFDGDNVSDKVDFNCSKIIGNVGRNFIAGLVRQQVFAILLHILSETV